MAEINTKAYLVLLARLIVSAAFIMAALPKIQDPLAFADSVEAFRVVGTGFSDWTALILPWLELVIGIGLLAPQIRRASALLILGLLILFIGLHASAWIRGLDISCGCFGENPTEEAPNYFWLILRNLGLLFAVCIVFIRDFRNPCLVMETKAESVS